MNQAHPQSCSAFAGGERIANGSLKEVATTCKRFVDSGDARPLLVFDDEDARPIELDLRGQAQDVLRRLADGAPPAAVEGPAAASEPRGAGRPRLGVVGREVTLLPRHWEWLGAQPGGASVTLRKLVEQARRANEGADRIRRAQESAFRFMSALAGNERGYEEACRALFAGDRSRFEQHSEPWPHDVREYARGLATRAFAEKER